MLNSRLADAQIQRCCRRTRYISHCFCECHTNQTEHSCKNKTLIQTEALSTHKTKFAHKRIVFYLPPSPCQLLTQKADAIPFQTTPLLPSDFSTLIKSLASAFSAKQSETSNPTNRKTTPLFRCCHRTWYI